MSAIFLDVFLIRLMNELPPSISQHFKLYQVGSQVIYPIRGPSDGLSPFSIYYLVSQKNYYIFGVEVYNVISFKAFEVVFYIAIIKFLKLLGTGQARTYNPDGGDLGRGDLKIEFRS